MSSVHVDPRWKDEPYLVNAIPVVEVARTFAAIQMLLDLMVLATGLVWKHLVTDGALFRMRAPAGRTVLVVIFIRVVVVFAVGVGVIVVVVVIVKKMTGCVAVLLQRSPPGGERLVARRARVHGGLFESCWLQSCTWMRRRKKRKLKI